MNSWYAKELPLQLAYLDGFVCFFEEEVLTKLPLHLPGHDVVFGMERPVQFLLLEKETIDELLKTDFIQPYI